MARGSSPVTDHLPSEQVGSGLELALGPSLSVVMAPGVLRIEDCLGKQVT